MFERLKIKLFGKKSPYKRFSYQDFHPLLELKERESVHETCGLLFQDPETGDLFIERVPSLKPSISSYRIGRTAWLRGYLRAKKEGKKLMGSIHVHCWGSERPSDLDLKLSRKTTQLRCIFCPRTGGVVLYQRGKILDWYKVEVPRNPVTEKWLEPL